MVEKMSNFEEYIVRGIKRLRCGYTTGTCAAAAAKSSAYALLCGSTLEKTSVLTPAGKKICLDIVLCKKEGETYVSAVKKDAGDDKDVTDGILVYAAVERTNTGFTVQGGKGVGVVTRKGLRSKIGCAAINPVPYNMIINELKTQAQKHGYTGGLKAVIFVPNGEEIAKKTFNSRLGIQGGISILGTTGIVEPMSEDALLETIKAEIDIKASAKENVLLISPGNYGRDFLKNKFYIDIENAVKCSNFVGQALDYAVYKGFEKIVLIAHAGKFIKVAGGIMQTHSKYADARLEILTAHAALCGLNVNKLKELYSCTTIDEADELLNIWKIADKVWESVCQKLEFHLQYRTKMYVEFISFTQRAVVMKSKNIISVLKEYNK